MSFKIGDEVTISSKQQLMKHHGRITQIGKKEIEITNGFETVRVDLYSWEVRKI